MYNKIKYCIKILLYTLILISLPSCNDNPISDEEDLIYGKWRVTQIIGDTSSKFDLKYVIFNKNFSCYLLYINEDYSFKEKYFYTFQLSDAKIILNEDFNFEYSINKNNLMLIHPWGIKYICTRDNFAPSENEWVKSPIIEYSISVQDDIRDMAFFDGKIFYSARNVIRVLDTSNNTIINNINLSRNVLGIEFLLSSLWITYSNDNKLSNIYSNSGTEIRHSQEIGYIEAITNDGNDLMFFSQNKFYRYNPRDNISTHIFNLDIFPEGITFASGYLYILYNNFVHKCSIEPFRAVESYEFATSSGIVFDGEYFWISSYRGEHKISKVKFPINQNPIFPWNQGPHLFKE